MRRYWSDQDLKTIFEEQTILEIDGDLFHHIVDVCRQGVGSKFELIGIDGLAYLSEVVSVQKKKAQIQLSESRQLPQPKSPYINLVMCVPRFPVLESVLEKATELGVKSIQLVFSDYSFIHDGKMISDSKWERWQKIIVSATQQSGRGDLLKIHQPVQLDDYLVQFNPNKSDFGLFAYELQTDLSVQDYIRSARPKSESKDLFIFVGAEGGYSEREVKLFKSLGLTPVSLGEQVLRVETACISLVSILKYEFGL